jgi:hypothetical protein
MAVEQQEQLLIRLQSQEPGAFKEFMIHFTWDLYTIADNTLGNAAHGHDVVGDLLLDIYNAGFADVTVPITPCLLDKLHGYLEIEKTLLA